MKNKYTAILLALLIFALPAFVFAQTEEVGNESDPAVVEVLQEGDEGFVPPAEEEQLDPEAGIGDRPEPTLFEDAEGEDQDGNDAAIPISEIEMPEVTIQVEQLAWDTFRFRPSLQLGLADYEYTWRFGDGRESRDRVVEYTYKKPGNYRVTLRWSDDEGSLKVSTSQVKVGFLNLANWRLWMFIVLLALLIIVASIIAGLNIKSEKERQ